MPSPSTAAAKWNTAASLYERLKNVVLDYHGIATDYVRALDERPAVKEELAELGISSEFLRRLENVGRNLADERLLVASGRYVAGLLRCPVSEQHAALEKGVEVLGPDLQNSRLIQPDQLTPEQTRQVFARDHIRTLAEQRTWLETEKRRAIPATPAADYRVCKDHVVTTRAGKWSKKLILQWVMEMN